MFSAHFPSFAFLTLSFCSCLQVALATEQEQASTEYTKSSEFQKAILNVTNTYRKQHNATSLSWNKTLAAYAEKWSDACVFKHSGGPYGENLASGYSNASASIVAWGHERVDYDFKKGDFSKETGHFTQLVWKSTTSVGCSRAECNGRGGGGAPGWYVVCEYYPPGNVLGAFQENVQEQVTEEEQPEGPDDPEVPNEEDPKEECPQGAVCSAAERTVGELGRLWVSGLIFVLGCGGWLGW